MEKADTASHNGERAARRAGVEAHSSQDIPDYRPLSLRRPFLLFLGAYLIALIVVLEYGCRVLPEAENRQGIPHDEQGNLPFIPLVSAALANAQVDPTRLHPARQTAITETPANVSAAASGFANSTSSAASHSTPPANSSATTSPSIAVDSARFGDRTGYFVTPSPTGSLNARAQPWYNFATVTGPSARIQFGIEVHNTVNSDVMGMMLGRSHDEQPRGVGPDWTYYVLWMQYWDASQEHFGADCWIQCNGPALLFSNEDCWNRWKSGEDRVPFYERVVGHALSRGKFDERGSARCPLPDAGQLATLGPPNPALGASPTPSVAGPVGQAPPTAQPGGAAGGGSVMTELPALPSDIVLSTATLRDGHASPTATVTEQPLTLRDANGRPTAVVPGYIVTLRDHDGKPTATLTEEVLTLRDSNGHPRMTVTQLYTPAIAAGIIPSYYPAGANGTGGFGDVSPERFHPLSLEEYAMGTTFPIFLTVFLSILTQTLRSGLKALLPFNALTRPGGARAEDSIGMETDGISGFVNSWRLAVTFRQPLSLLADLLVVVAAALIPLSSEAVGLKLHGDCRIGAFTGCYMNLAYFNGPIRAVEGLLIFMLLVVVIGTALLFSWRSGAVAPPRSIAVAASLLQDRETRSLAMSLYAGSYGQSASRGRLSERLARYKFWIRRSGGEYGLVAKANTEAGRGNEQGSVNLFVDWLTETPLKGHTAQIALCLVLCGLLVLIVFYEVTIRPISDPFEYFMDSQLLGVRALFSALGVMISFLWDHLYSRESSPPSFSSMNSTIFLMSEADDMFKIGVSALEPYRQLSRCPQTADRSILVSPSTNAFLGFGPALVRRDWITAVIALNTVLSKFTPIMLANIPFNLTQTWTVHLVYAWLTVGILGFMIVSLGLWSVIVKYPYLPVDPGNLLGQIAYVCDSAMVDDFRGKSLLKSKERDKAVMALSLKYKFGKIVGLSGEVRPGIDHVDESGV